MLSDKPKIPATTKSEAQPNDQDVENENINKPSLGKITLNSRELEEIKLISQGGYAYIFEVKDLNTNEIFALKKMICQSPERLRTAKNEISMLQSIPQNLHLLKFIDSKIIKVQDGHHAYLLLEFCEGGSLFDLIVKHQETKFDENQIISIMKEICDGVKALHSCNPPIAHRDLKIENVLMHENTWKLCDFGSCSSSTVNFSKIPQDQIINYEEEYEKNTTLMYRPPEMCDPYLRYTVDNKVDIWMLGCILYTLCFFRHPFQGTSKLSIINAAFKFPKEPSYPEKLIDLMRIMLTPNPEHRASIFEITKILDDYSSLESIPLNSDAQRIKDEALEHSNQPKTTSHEGDIPVEELMKLQMKVQKSQKSDKSKSKKDDASGFKGWDDVKPKVPNPHKVQPTSGNAFNDFNSFGFSSFETKTNQNQQTNFGFDSFDQFSNNQNPNVAKTSDQGWNDFGFGQTNSSPEKNTTTSNTLSFGEWGTSSTTNQTSAKDTDNTKQDKSSFDAFNNF